MAGENNAIKLRFTNPLTNKSDCVTVYSEDLQTLKESGRGDGLIIISFFHTTGESNYVVNLHLDSNYNVRSVLTSNFFLKAPNNKLFRGWVQPAPYSSKQKEE